ncbi:MAG: hypothetical protein IID39_10585, partial [Planctomycetes bacterium]|nr:hypothetical protein [Planctomycetota bacterium]
MPENQSIESVESQTGKSGVLLVATLMGGTLVFSSFVAAFLFRDSLIRDSSGVMRNPYSDFIALIGAVLLGLPLVWHAMVHLYRGEIHMDELVAMAVVAAIALQQYQMAGIVAFFMIIANLIETRTALGARASIASLLRFTPKEAHRLEASGEEVMVNVED